MILITGAAGFIGSVLLRELNLKGINKIIAIDKIEGLLNLKKGNYKQYLDASMLLKNDFPWKSISYVFHLGACSSTTEMNIEFLKENNIEYSKHIFTNCAKFQIPLIYASSAATYGDGSTGYDDAHDIIPSLKPLNPYGNSKQVFDEWVLKQKEMPPIWFGLKFFNVYGPNEYHKGHMMSVVKKAFDQIKENGKVELFKSYKKEFPHGGQLRDFIYVKDVVKAMIEMFKIGLSSSSGIYNLGTGKARSFSDLVSSVFKGLNLNVNIDFIEMPENLKSQYQYYTQANMDKFFTFFSDIKFSSLEEGIFDYIKKYLVKEDIYY